MAKFLQDSQPLTEAIAKLQPLVGANRDLERALQLLQRAQKSSKPADALVLVDLENACSRMRLHVAQHAELAAIVALVESAHAEAAQAGSDDDKPTPKN